MKSDGEDTTVVYIAGYNRSGSTILGILLGQHPEAIVLGEMQVLHKRLLENEGKCACSLPPRECSFWKQIYERCFSTQAIEKQQTPDLQSAIESTGNYISLALGLKSKQTLRRYAEQTQTFFRTAAEVSKKRYVIDLSKSARRCAGRPLALVAHTNLNVKVIHLTRDGRGCIWSYMKQQGGPENNRRTYSRLFNFLHTMGSWLITHCLAIITSWILPRDAVLRVRYEDLCESPKEVLKQIGEFIGMDIQPALRKIENHESLDVGHVYGGNPTRFAEGLKFRPDREWHAKLPMSYQRAFMFAAWPVVRWLGYK